MNIFKTMYINMMIDLVLYVMKRIKNNHLVELIIFVFMKMIMVINHQIIQDILLEYQ